jgi:hypothetical protein
MAKGNRTSSGFLSAPEYAYLATLAIFFAASFFPEERVWGINWWAYWPVWARTALLVTAAALIPVARRVARSQMWDVDITQNAYRLGAFLIIVAACVLFWFLRARAHFLGDGYTLLGMLSSDDPLIKGRNLGGMLPQLWLTRLLGGPEKANVLTAYQAVSQSVGFLFAALTILLANQLLSKRIDRLLFAGLMLSGGFSLQFFGYVENYALFLLWTLTFVLVGWLILEEKAPRWLIIPCTLVAALFHVFGVVLIPGALYVLLQNTGISARFAALSTTINAAIAAGAVFLAGVGFAYAYQNNYFFRFAYVPLMGDRFTVDGYTLLSISHLLDLLNLGVVVVPAIVVAAILAGQFGAPRAFRRPLTIFLLLVTACTLGTAVVFDPKLGMPRDWDLFSFWGIPALVLLWTLLRNADIRRYGIRAGLLLVIILNTTMLVSRAFVQHLPSQAIEHFQNYLLLDRVKSRPGTYILAQFFRDQGDTRTAQILDSARSQLFPEERMVRHARGLYDAGHFAEAQALLRQVLQFDAIYADAWIGLGACETTYGQLDSAEVSLRVAVGLSPYSVAGWSELARLKAIRGDTAAAARLWLKASAMDEGDDGPLYDLSQMYLSLRDTVSYARRLTEAAATHRARAKVIAELAAYRLAHGDVDDGVALYRKALSRGLDSAIVRAKAEQYPELKSIL